MPEGLPGDEKVTYLIQIVSLKTMIYYAITGEMAELITRCIISESLVFKYKSEMAELATQYEISE